MWDCPPISGVSLVLATIYYKKLFIMNILNVFKNLSYSFSYVD
jgi:hypothetical protein